ncbi:GtrA family protein [Aquipuribacter sp. SD81]|uniref:GtrA family protein n=1 Tax=Aquipuribacter sp. SD81 TaxID=3127703 RepID=UPI0030161124
MPDAPPPPSRLARARRLAGDERVLFVGVGAVNTLIGTVAFVGLQLTLGRVAHYLVVLLAAHVVSVLCAFVLHRRLVFRVRGNVLLDLLRFETVYLGALGVNLLALPLLVEVAGLPVIPSQLLVVFVTALMSYVGHKYFSFRRKQAA